MVVNTAEVELQRRRAIRERIKKGGWEAFILYMAVIFEEKYKKKLRTTWFDPLLARALWNILIGKEDRLIISMPPRYGKTERAVRLFVSFALGMAKNYLKRQIKIQYITYGADLTDDTSVDTKLIIESEIYQKIFPNIEFEQMQNKKSNFKLKDGSEFFGTSIGGAITGKGSHITIIDDPHKAAEADSEAAKKEVVKFYQNSVLSRLEEEENDEENEADTGINPAIVVIMQRLHEDDLVGWLIKNQGLKKDGGVWTEVKLAALNEHKEIYEYDDFKYIREPNTPLDAKKHSAESLHRKKREMGSKEYQKQMQQDVENSATGHFKEEDFTFITDIDMPRVNKYISIDNAESLQEGADDRAIGVVGWSINEEGIEMQIIIDGKRGKWDVYGTCENIIELMIKHRDAEVWIEGAGAGITLEVVLKKEIAKVNAKLRREAKEPLINGVTVYPTNTKISKQSKIKYMTAPIENHTFKIHKSCDTDFKSQFIKEARKFDPERKHQKDNCIDCISSTWLFAVAKKNFASEKSITSNTRSRKKSKKWRGI